MAKVKQDSVINTVFRALDKRLELGGPTELALIEKQSQNDIDSMINEFRANYSHLIAYPFKNGTVNRAIEKWLYKQYNVFNK